MSLINKVYTAQDMRDAAKCLFACEVDLKHDNRDISRMLRQSADMMDMSVGNAAEMCKALESVRNWCLNRLFNSPHQVTVEGLLSVVNAALSTQPRNCDAFSKAQILEMLEDRSFSKEDTIEWLFDKAKGEADGIE